MNEKEWLLSQLFNQQDGRREGKMKKGNGMEGEYLFRDMEKVETIILDSIIEGTTVKKKKY